MSRTRLYLLGRGIDYSLSPSLHQEWLSANRPKVSYRLVDIPEEEFDRVVAELLSDPTTLGLNITKPYKERIVRHLPRLTLEAHAIGAVNTVFLREGEWWGANTDAPALAAELSPLLRVFPTRRALVLGAGGAARAVVYTLLGLGIGEIAIASRRPEQAGRLSYHFGQGVRAVLAMSWPLRGQAVAGALVINATPAGTEGSPTPLAADHLQGARLVYDLVYTPRPTPLEMAATLAGIPARNGFGMLVRQAELARKLWFGEWGG